MPVGALSGGEQARVVIARLMLQPADLLILDEPTNDLDIPSLEVLEESLAEFPGAILLVTRDRYLLETVATEILAFDGSGGHGFFADHAQWEAVRAEARAAEELKSATPSPKARPAPKAAGGLTTQERRELSRMEEAILAAEEVAAALQARMTSPEVASNHVKLQEAWQALEKAQAETARLYARWEDLEARQKS